MEVEGYDGWYEEDGAKKWNSFMIAFMRLRKIDIICNCKDMNWIERLLSA